MATTKQSDLDEDNDSNESNMQSHQTLHGEQLYNNKETKTIWNLKTQSLNKSIRSIRRNIYIYIYERDNGYERWKCRELRAH